MDCIGLLSLCTHVALHCVKTARGGVMCHHSMLCKVAADAGSASTNILVGKNAEIVFFNNVHDFCCIGSLPRLPGSIAEVPGTLRGLFWKYLSMIFVGVCRELAGNVRRSAVLLLRGFMRRDALAKWFTLEKNENPMEKR